MQHGSSVILLATNSSESTLDLLSPSHSFQKLQHQIAISNYKNSLSLIPAYSDEQILEQLHQHGEKVTALHFEGQSENYEALLEKSKSSLTEYLPDYLGQLANLRYVFLSGCATDEHVDELLFYGVPVVISSSQKLSSESIQLFADEFYRMLLENASLEEATRAAKEVLGLDSVWQQRIFVNISGDHETRKWRLSPHIIGGSSPNILGNSTFDTDVSQLLKPKSSKETSFAEKFTIPDWMLPEVAEQDTKLMVLNKAQLVSRTVPSGYKAILRLLTNHSHSIPEQSQLLVGETLFLDKRYVLQLEMIRQLDSKSQALSRDIVKRRKQIDVTLFVHGMELGPFWHQTKTVTDSNNPFVFSFDLRPINTGNQTIRIEIYYDLHWVKQIMWDISVVP